MQTLKIKTVILQSLVSKTIKGASNNKMIPITSFLNISLANNKLTLTTTDATNTLQVIENKVEGEDFYVTLVADTFSKLVAKTTSPFITLTLNDGDFHLEFEGNGKYSIELPVDEENELIKFPEIKFKKNAKVTKAKLPVIKAIIRTNKAAIADTMDIPMLTGYYFNAEGTHTTDQFKICSSKIPLFTQDVLVPSDLMDLVSLIDSEDIKIQLDGSKLLFTSDTVIVHGSVLDGVEDYPIDAVMQFTNTEFESSAQVARQAFLDIIDRLTLFVSAYDKNTIYMTFTKDGILITSKKSNGAEKLSYQGSENFKPYTCAVDIEVLKSQLQAQEGEVVNLWYGNETALKMTFDNVVQVVALLEDERTEGVESDE